MPFSGNNTLYKEQSGTRSIWTMIILALVAIAALLLVVRSCGTSASSSTIADVLVIEPVGFTGAKQILQRTKGDIVRIQWSNGDRLRDTVLHYGAAGDEEEEMARILSNADRMNAELVQRGLKTIIRRSTAIEIDTMVGNWSFIAVGALPFYQGLVKAGETDMLRRNPKLSAWFFVPPLHDDSLAVTDALIELLRNEGVAVKREILQ